MSTLPMARRGALVFATTLVSLAALSSACSGSKAVPTAPDINNISRPISPPAPGGITVGAAVGRAPSVVAFLVGPLGGVTSYSAFFIMIGSAVFGFMQVLGRDEHNGTGPKP